MAEPRILVAGASGYAGALAAELVALRTKRLSVKSFMDAWTMNIERLQQCCVHVGSVDPESDPVRIPFCARQLFGGPHTLGTVTADPRQHSAQRG